MTDHTNENKQQSYLVEREQHQCFSNSFALQQTISTKRKNFKRVLKNNHLTTFPQIKFPHFGSHTQKSCI